jgi:hypothetical protein
MYTFRRFVGALALVALILPFDGFAQETVKIEPAIIEERVDPGQVFRSSLRVTNDSPETRTYFLLTRDISDMVGNRPVFAEPGEILETGVSAWVKLSAQSVTLKPGELKEVPFTVTVPKDAFPGSHLGGVFLSLQSNRPSETGAGIGYQIGSILIFRLSGNADEAARIREFKVDRNIYSRPEVNFSIKVENQGNVLVRPRGPIEIQNMFGKVVGKLTMNDEALSVFPGKDRGFSVTWNSDEFAFGRYQAVVSLVYGEDVRKTISSAVSFWVLPFDIIIPVVVGILIGFLIVFVLLRWYVRRKVTQLQGGAVRRAPSRSDLSFSRLLMLTFLMLGFVLVLLVLLAIFFGS